MTVYPNCKINIGLAVTHKREDGYHDLDTIFYPVYGLHDEMEVDVIAQDGDTILLEQEGITVDCASEDNLIVKCYRLLKAYRSSTIGSVKVRFRKNIPFGAGLGGGSADATFMAQALNKLFGLGMDTYEIATLVKQLGADCPFFAYNEPCHATGIGDILTPVEQESEAWKAEYKPFLDSLRGKRLVLVKPDTHVSTKEAYGGIVPRDKQTCPPTTLLVNDFEQTVFAHHPELAEIKQALLDAGAIYAAMSGSGSTLFGFYEPDHELILPEQITPYVIYNQIQP